MCKPNKNQRSSPSTISTLLSSPSAIEMSRHHPRGMLDRDQRTTISVLKKTEKITENLENINSLNINNNNKLNNKRNNQEYDTLCNDRSEIYLSKSINNINNKLNHNNNNNNDNHYLNTNTTLVDTKCKRDRSVLLNINKNHEKHVLSVSKNINTKCYSTRNQTKFSSVLFRVCFWLLILQKARARPTMVDPRTCELLYKVFAQTRNAFENQWRHLDEFAQAIVNENHINAHMTWLHTDWKGLQPPNKNFTFSNYTEIPDDVVAHLDIEDREVLATELQNIHERLQRITIATNQIMEEHESKKNQHLHVYTGNENNFHIKSSFFSNQRGYLGTVIELVEKTLKHLNQDEEFLTVDRIEPHDIGSPDVRDWVVTREHLKLLQYIIKASAKLMEGCPNQIYLLNNKN